MSDTEAILKLREGTKHRTNEQLLAEVLYHVANARAGKEVLGSVRASILLLEVVQIRLQ